MAAAVEHVRVSPWRKADERERDRELKREAVLRTAAQLFNEKGFHRTSLDEVAERLHVTKPTLYYYVKNKDEILFECVRTGLAMVHEGIETTRRAGGSALDQLVACMHVYARIVTMDFGQCVIRIGEDPLPPHRRVELRQLKAGIDAEFRRLIERGIAEGELLPCDPKLAAFTLAGAISWIGRWYRSDGPLDPEEIAGQCIAVLLNGVVRQRPSEPVPEKNSAAKRRASRPTTHKGDKR